MRKTIVEDWEFTITVLTARSCRMGLEPGDTFHCTYSCPAGFCPKTMAVLHSLCEGAPAGGDYRLLGGRSAHEMDFSCADGEVKFHLTAHHID